MSAKKKSSAKKTSTKKSSAKKSEKKSDLKASSKKKKAVKKSVSKKPETENLQAPATLSEPGKDCMCKQKKPNGNFFYFRLVQGRWVQSSAIGFPTKETCEAAFCDD